MLGQEWLFNGILRKQGSSVKWWRDAALGDNRDWQGRVSERRC